MLKRIAAAIVVILTIATIGLGDAPRSRDKYMSQNGKYTLKIVPGYYGRGLQDWQLIENSTKTIVYSIKERLGEKSVLVSDDGQYIASIDDYSRQDFRDNPIVLQFFQAGKPTKEYKLKELLQDPNSISVSVSHFRWLSTYKFEIVDGEINLTTLEKTRLKFDLKTGAKSLVDN